MKMLHMMAITFAGLVGASCGVREDFHTRLALPDLDDDTGHRFATLANMVSRSDAIVVADYKQVTDMGEVLFATAWAPTAPDEIFPLLRTRYLVKDVLKSDGLVATTSPITLSYSAHMPEGTAEHSIDAGTDFPQVWPVDTEFILFLVDTSDGDYGVARDACGRILTGGSQVTCSDGDRTVLDFMTGLDRDEFIAAVQTEIASPSDTETPWPTQVPDETPTP